MKSHSDFFRGADATWQKVAITRRSIMFISIFLIECITVYWFSSNLSSSFPLILQALIVIPFAILLFWLQLGFFTAIAGLWVSFRRGRFRILPPQDSPIPPIDPQKTTAILLPIYNEDVAYVYAGLKSMYQSLKDHQALECFEFYILSDSDDVSIRLQEGAAWLSLCDELDAHGRIHYRQRKHRKKKKSGNVMDFCRRWGKRHPYMIVLDADSLMSGATLQRLVSVMEQNPKVALIQSPLYTSGVSTIFSRYFQFLNRLYGPVFFAGLHWWWLGESQYWGHNVIIRTQAFMDHCDLPRLERGGHLDGDILSHDFVEAALLNRAGWETWLAFNLENSIERPPPTLTDAMKRDRRWCQGNLQHWHIIWSRGITHMQRFLMLGGILSYATSAVWLVWLLVLSYSAVVYPDTPVIPHTEGTIALTLLSIALLFFYKLFGLFEAFKDDAVKNFGGWMNAGIGVIAESIISILITPVKMLYYTRFIVEILAGKRATWTTQQRIGRRLAWRETWQEYRWVVFIGAIWSAILASFNPVVFLWMLPVLAGMLLVVPIAVLTSSPMDNQRPLFRIPHDVKPPDVLQYFDQYYDELLQSPYLTAKDPFVRVIVDPVAHRKHLAYLPCRSNVPSKTRQYREEIACRLMEGGPDTITAAERMIILEDPMLLCRLHTQIWQLPQNEFEALWLSKA